METGAMAEHSNPGRDRHLAAQHRIGPRWADPIEKSLEKILDRNTRNRMRRYAKAVEVIRAQVPESVFTQIELVDCKAGVLTIAISAGPLLAEFSQHYAAGLQSALVAAGTGISRLRCIRRG
jgi:hypothetical protein